ncbi:MAG: twin-arginine translocation signal domain-containing protein, partial [Chloroflexota bacterium]|nr:twin-arginine translocation signal domain-containing protein [Chloroflexota bacterium]
MTQHHPTESTHPLPAPRALTRRRALRLAGIAGAGALAAACGEPDIPKIQPPVLPSTQRTQAAATQATESAATPLPTVIV